MAENVQRAINNFSVAGNLPNLENLAAMRIVIETWRHVDMPTAVQDRSWEQRVMEGVELITDNFGTLATRVRTNLKLIPPLYLREKTLYFVIPIGLHLFQCIAFVRNFIPFLGAEEIVQSIRWSAYGNVDYYQSVNSLLDITRRMRNDVRALQSSFLIALYTCNERHIQNLWGEMSEEMRQEYSRDYDANPNHVLSIYFVLCYLLRRERTFRIIKANLWQTYFPDTVIPSNEYYYGSIDRVMFLYAVSQGNPYAVKYFQSRLSLEDRGYCAFHFSLLILRNAVISGNITPGSIDSVVYMFARLTRRFQVNVLKRYAFHVFRVMIKRWMYQKFLPHLIEQTSDILRADIFCEIFEYIRKSILDELFAEEELIEKIWSAITERKKRQFFRYVLLDIKNFHLLGEDLREPFLFIMNDSIVSERNGIYAFYEI